MSQLNIVKLNLQGFQLEKHYTCKFEGCYLYIGHVEISCVTSFSRLIFFIYIFIKRKNISNITKCRICCHVS